jgi:hypothetical protein
VRTGILRPIFLLLAGIAGAAGITPAQQRPSSLDDATVAKRNATEQELESIAIIDRKVMVAMRDGKRMATDIYRPKDTTKKYPVIFVRTPYNFNYWDVANGVPRDMSTELDAVKRGYAYVEMNERGHFFSEGNYDILGPPQSDGDDAISWIAEQVWSNAKVGTIGCSSSAEWQLGVASLGNKAYAAMIPESFGAGVGRVGPLRARELVSWRRRPDAFHLMDIRGAKSGEADVSPDHFAGRSDPRVEGVRSGAAFAAYGLGESAPPSPRDGHSEGRGRTTRNFCR